VSSPGDVIAAICSLLDAAGITYMIVGSFASSVHGHPRTTHGLDVVIDPTPEQLDRWLSAVDERRWYVDPDVAREALARRSMFNVIDSESGWKIDLIVRKARPFSVEELSRREAVAIFGIRAQLASAEDTILSKLEWAKASGSERQLEDVKGILRVRGGTIDRDYIDRWADALDVAALWRRASELE